MTTVAYDGVSMAADRCSTMGIIKLLSDSKLARVKVPGRGEFVIGVAGDSYFADALLAALQAGSDVPDVTRYGNADHPYGTVALAASRRRGVWLINGLGDWLPVHQKLVSIGSGCEFAMGAMAAGATARTAVLLAAKHTDASALGVVVERV